MVIERLNQTIDIWVQELGLYDFGQLCAKPSPGSWSLGQVYMHLIDATDYFILQARICANTNDNARKESSTAAKKMFLKNDFPDMVLEGPPSNANTPQPETKDQLIHALQNLQKDIGLVGALVEKSACKGKTKHPGLNYFNAIEWLQFAEMHLRHHLRQKKRIDDYLRMKKNC